MISMSYDTSSISANSTDVTSTEVTWGNNVIAVRSEKMEFVEEESVECVESNMDEFERPFRLPSHERSRLRRPPTSRPMFLAGGLYRPA